MLKLKWAACFMTFYILHVKGKYPFILKHFQGKIIKFHGDDD